MLEKISNFLLKKSTINAKVLDFKLNNNHINLKIRIEYNDNLGLNQSKPIQNFQMVIKGRERSNQYGYRPKKVDFSSNYIESYFEIPVSLFNVTYNEIWDFYFDLGLENKKQLIRIKNFLFDSSEKNYFRINNNVTLDVYTTVKGNFSIKTIYNDIAAYVNQIDCINDNELFISGLILGLEMSNINNINLIMENSNLASSYKTRLEIKEQKNYLVFNNRILLQELTLDFSKNEYKFYIEIHYNEGEILVDRKPVSVEYNVNFLDDELYVKNESAEYKVTFKINNKYRNLSLLFHCQSHKLEVTRIDVTQDNVKITGYVKDGNQKNINGKFPLFLKRREHEEIIQDEVVIINNQYSYVLGVKSLVEAGILTNGIWDLYLEINGVEYRFASRDDGIENKRKIVSFPQVKLTTKDGEIKVVKPYYSLHDEVSLLVRNYIVNKKIDDIYFGSNFMQINGVLTIQPPNDDVESQLNGTVKFNLPYGEKLELPLKTNLRRLGKSKLDFAYDIFINMNRQLRQNIFENLHFDLLELKLYLKNGYSIFYINAVPSYIVNKAEKLIKKSGRIKNLLEKVKLKSYYLMNKMLPIDHKLIIFQCTTGMNYSCNPRAIYEQLLEENQNFKAVWVVNNIQSKIPGNPKIVKQYSLKYYYYMARGKFFINNGNFPNFYVKRKQTIHIQTWHGTPLKRLGFDIDPSSPSYKENTSEQLMKRIARWDYLVAPNEYTGKILKRAYKYKNKLLKIGYPRNDIFYKPEQIKNKIIKETKEYFNIPMNKKVILYAPTWRDNEFHQGLANEPYNFKFSLDRFAENFGEEYVLLVRLHPREAVRCQIKEYENVVYNVTNFDDIKYLYLITDILITDYSSVMFDFANTKKPIIFFAHDIEKYSSSLRGFYFNLYEEAPGPIVTSEAELFETIRNIEQINSVFKEKYDLFYNKFCSWEDGNASKRVIDQVINAVKREI